MKTFKKICLNTTVVFALISSSSQVYAYLDPGTGSMLIQMIIGGIVAGFFTLRMYWYQLKSYVRRKLGYPVEESSTDDLNAVDKTKD